ncbi:hypothetical protein [Paenibacillus donghaensis]|uniref:hypothetical protein n=1 Tax=Paenibacillus donghaensis TaxID=414771 RepID=UPI0012FC63CB|nr:hypothetical protein [Paenibacillus donghaensis]
MLLKLLIQSAEGNLQASSPALTGVTTALSQRNISVTRVFTGVGAIAAATAKRAGRNSEPTVPPALRCPSGGAAHAGAGLALPASAAQRPRERR